MEQEIIEIGKVPQIDNDKNFYEVNEKIVGYLKRRIRSSFEYQYLMSFIKSKHGIDSCIYHKNYSVTNGFQVEIHHTPFTITDIIWTVCNKHIKLYDKFTEDKICVEVMELHYKLMVGLTPLCPTCHKLVHSSKIDIHPDSIYSKGWIEWYKNYEQFVEDSVTDKYEKAIALSKKKTDISQYPKILEKKQIILVSDNSNQITTDVYKKLLIDDKLSKLEETNGC